MTCRVGATREEVYRLLMADVLELAGRSRFVSDARAREFGLSVAQWRLMSVLSSGPRSVASAASRLGLARQSVQRVANDLVDEALATSSPDPNDARAPLFALTVQGRRLTSELHDRLSADRRAVLQRTSLSERNLRDACRTIRALLEQLTIQNANDR